MRHQLVALTFCLVAGIATPTSALAQQTPPPIYVRNLEEMSRYADRGMLIGAGAGLVYGLIATRNNPSNERPLLITVDVVVGGVVGMTVGAAVYLIKSAARKVRS